MNIPRIESSLLPSDHEFERMKNDLFERIEESETRSTPHLVPARKKRARPRRRTAWAVFSGLAVASLAIALVVTVGIGPHAGSANAAEVLHNAALATIRTSDPVVGPGQYLKVATTIGMSNEEDKFAQLSPSATTTYIPYDQSGIWVFGQQHFPAIKSYGDPKSVANALSTDPNAYKLQLYQLPGGLFQGQPFHYGADIAKLPRDSAALRTYLYDHAEGSASKDEAVFDGIKDSLTSGLVSADLRSAMYQVLAQIPGVYIAREQANLDVKTGVAISRQEPTRTYVDQIIIDPNTGLLIGAREVLTTRWAVIPAGTTLGSTAFSTTVVDQPPSGPYAVMK